MILEKSLSGIVRYYLSEIQEIYNFMNSLVGFIKKEHSYPKEEKQNSNSNGLKYWKDFSEEIIQEQNSRLFKMVHVALIALFEAFNKDFFTILLSAKPKSMRTKSKKISFEEIIRFGSLEKLYEFLALQITDKFGRQNIDDLAKFINDSFKIDLNLKFEDWEKLRENYYRRNLTVHNKCKISNDYIEKINGYGPDDINKELKIDYSYIYDCIDHLWKYIELLFKEIVNKFKLKVVPENVFDLDYPDPLLFKDIE